MISTTREYFKSIIRTIDPDLKFDGLLNDTEKIGSTALDRTFKMTFGNIKPGTEDSTILSLLPVEIRIYKKLCGQNPVEDYDKAYCKAIDIHALAQNRKSYDQVDFIKRVECDEILPESVETDDKTYRFIMQFTVTLGYVYN